MPAVVASIRPGSPHGGIFPSTHLRWLSRSRSGVCLLILLRLLRPLRVERIGSGSCPSPRGASLSSNAVVHRKKRQADLVRPVQPDRRSALAIQRARRAMVPSAGTQPTVRDFVLAHSTSAAQRFPRHSALGTGGSPRRLLRRRKHRNLPCLDNLRKTRAEARPMRAVLTGPCSRVWSGRRSGISMKRCIYCDVPAFLGQRTGKPRPGPCAGSVRPTCRSAGSTRAM